MCVSHLTLRVLEIMPPQWANFVLPTDIPHCETDIFVLNGLHVKTYMEKNTRKIWH